MAHLIGTELVDRFTVLDDEGVYVTGETFTADQVRDPANDVFDYTVTELGSGLYEVRFDLDLAGVYYLRLVTDTLVPAQVYEFQVQTDDPEVGSTVTHYFTVRDDDGVYHPGSSVTVVDAYDPSGMVFVPIIDDLGSGLYRVTWDTDSEGIYTLRLSADLTDVGDEAQIFEFETRVLPSAQDDETPFSSVVGSTLDDLVQRVARACRDLLSTTASEDSDSGTWHDDLELVARSPKALKGASLFVKTAAAAENIGREVRVRDSVDGALVLSPALPADVRRGDRAYLTNLESSGFVRRSYVESLNDHIADIFPNCLRPASWTFTTVFDGAAPYLVPPEEFTHLTTVGYPASQWSPSEDFIPQFGINDYSAGWYWDEAQGRIVIQGGYVGAVSGMYLTIRGFGRWGALESDSDVTGIDSQWLVQQTAGDMILSLRDARRQSEAAMHINRADGYLPKAITNLPPNTIRIR